MNLAYGILGTILLCLATAIGAYNAGHADAKLEADLDMALHLQLDKQVENTALESARTAERKLAEAQAEIAAAYIKGKADAEATGKQVVADLRTGNLRLRNQWRSCEADRVSGATATTAGADASADDRAESAGRIVRAAREADEHIRALQALLIQERSTRQAGYWLQPAVSPLVPSA